LVQIPRVDDADNVQADAESVAAFFSATCAAGSNEDGPLLGGGTWDGLCTACKVATMLTACSGRARCARSVTDT
jgi:hypothetical protein